MRMGIRSVVAVALFATTGVAVTTTFGGAGTVHADGEVAAGGTLRVHVDEAVGGKTVFGQLTVADAADAGFVTAYGCADGLPREDGEVSKSDLNYNGHINPVASNRLIVTADADGDVCFYTLRTVHLIVDINGVTDTGITAIPNQRTDTRAALIKVCVGRDFETNKCIEWVDVPDTDGVQGTAAPIGALETLTVNVAEAGGAKTVFGQLTVADATGPGFVTAYGCADGLPRENGEVSKSDLNYDGRVSSVASNRLIVTADHDGDVCFYTSAATHIVVDLSATTSTGITPIPNQRVDTRTAHGNAELGICILLNPDGTCSKWVFVPRTDGPIAAGGATRVHVPAAIGGKTVFGQLTVADAAGPGFVTAFGCERGLPRDAHGISRSDLNFNGHVNSVASNRLVVQADDDGNICLYTSNEVHMVVDINAVTDAGVTPLPNQRTDTRQ